MNTAKACMLCSILTLSSIYISYGIQQSPITREELQGRIYTRTLHPMSGTQQERTVRYIETGKSINANRPITRRPHDSMRHTARDYR